MKNFYVVLGVVAIAGVAVVWWALQGGTPVMEPVDLGEITDQELSGSGAGRRLRR